VKGYIFEIPDAEYVMVVIPIYGHSIGVSQIALSYSEVYLSQESSDIFSWAVKFTYNSDQVAATCCLKFKM